MQAALKGGAWRPVARAALTSCAVMSTGDIVCQGIQRRNRGGGTHDWNRTAQFGLIGLTLHGPFFLWGFGMIDRRFGPSKTLLTAAKKTAFGQVTLFPAYVVAFFTYMTLLETRGDVGACADKLQSSFMRTYVAGSVFWPIANMINFTCVPSTGRILYVNAAGLLWNAYLSYVNSKSLDAHQQQPQQPAAQLKPHGKSG